MIPHAVFCFCPFSACEIVPGTIVVVVHVLVSSVGCAVWFLKHINAEMWIFEAKHKTAVLYFLDFPLYRVVNAAKAKAIEGSSGAASEGEKDAHELLRTLVSGHCGTPFLHLFVRSPRL